MRKLLKIFFFLCCTSGVALAQSDSLLLTKNFNFKDGVFLTFESFQKNQPTYLWEDLRTNLVSNPKTYMAQVEFMEVKNDSQKIDLTQIWGICLGGIPYIRLEKGAVKKELTTFAALKLRGKICYFQYQDFEEIAIPMSAYNPETGKPFRSALVNRKVDVIYEKILDFETGAIEDLTIENLKSWVKNDSQLVNALESLGADADEKLFKCILIYDDRNQVYVPANE